MSIQYNDLYVDEKYLPILEPNLYADTVIIPGVTFTDKYVTGPAGQLFIHKLAKGTAIAPGTPGRDFTHEENENELIPIALNNNFQKSAKMYGVQANAVAFQLAEANMSNAIAVVREGGQYSALACMVNEGTADTDTVAIATGAAAVEKIIELRKKIKDAHGQANFALVSTEMYALLLNELGFQKYADEAIVSANLLKRFGLNIIECNAFDNDEATYYDYAGTLQTVDLTLTEMIVGYSEAFSIVPNLEAMRVVDSPEFVGSLAQVEMNVGFRVTSADQIVVKAVAGS